MTVKQLFNALKDTDKDLENREVMLVIQKKIGMETIITIKTQLISVDENIDFKTGRLVLRAE